MVLKLHQIFQEFRKYDHSYLCWINEKPTWIGRHMMMQGDPNLEEYLGSYMLDILKKRLETNGSEHTVGPIMGHYRLEANSNNLQVTDTFRGDYIPVAGVANLFQKARDGEEFTFDRTKIFDDCGHLHYSFQPKKRKREKTPTTVYVRKDMVDYVQQAYKQFDTMRIRYDGEVTIYFHNENVAAGIARVNLSLP